MTAPARLVVPQSLRVMIAFVLICILPLWLAEVLGLLGFVGPEGLTVGLRAGCGLAATVAVLWFAFRLPPAVEILPAQVRRTVRAYVPFALVWFTFAAGYLYLMHAVGWTVPPQPVLERAADSGLTSGNDWWSLFEAVVLAPVGEELLFRGYLLGALLQSMPSWAAQLITAAAFGLAHGWEYALPIGVLGLFFGWLCLNQRSLLPAVLAHAMHNALMFCIVLLWPGSLELMYPG